MVTKKKSAVFGFIKERLQERLQGWDKKKLSKGGKEVLIKSVAQTLPNYSMSVFLLPIEVCNDLEKSMTKFWWRSDAKKDKCIHWMCWSRLCLSKTKGGMGFRNLRDFNIALLGNQAWRLLAFPDKLVSRIYKARYYLNGSFLTAKLGSNPSYIWRSVFEAQSLVANGISCRIGNGQEVDILNTPWLPLLEDPYIHSSNEALINQKVSSLMRIGEKAWDVDVVRDVFEERDANIILSIPLGDDDRDTWYWKHEKMGHYSVKSAYVLLQEAKANSNTVDNSGFWRRLWNLKIPSKIKNFLWRAVTGCLPSKDLLRVRHVQVNALCPVCNQTSETILHTLVTCPFAESCHHLGTFSEVLGEFNFFAEWLQLLFDQRRQDEVYIHVTICWLLWKNRNDLIWNQHSINSSELVNSASSILNQWRAVQDKNYDSFLGFMTLGDGQEQWHPPSLNSVKINIDAALFEDPMMYSYAFILRDHHGNFSEAISKCSFGRVSPEIVESLGIREALSWIKDKGYMDVVMETDCLQVVQLIRSSFTSFSYLGRVIEECRNLLLGLRNQNIMLRFVRRSANKVAHYLAR